MSSTTLYVVESDGTLSVFNEYKNSHGSAAAVWAHLAHKHIPNTSAPFDDYDPNKRHWMLDNKVVPELYEMANASAAGEQTALAEYEWRTLLAVADYVVIKTENILAYADALAEFAKEVAPQRQGAVFSIPQQVEDLREIANEPDARYRGVCWRQSSVSDVFDEGEMTAARRNALLRTKLSTELGEETAQKVADILEDWSPEDEWVPYNVDLDTRHAWL